MSILDNYYGEGKSIREKITELEEENRRLSEKNKIYSNALVQEKENNKSLKEENRFLEQCLDNKEKVNKSLREDLEIWKLTAKDYARQCGVDLDDDLKI